jgi:hypothetical protein
MSFNATKSKRRFFAVALFHNPNNASNPLGGTASEIDASSAHHSSKIWSRSREFGASAFAA